VIEITNDDRKLIGNKMLGLIEKTVNKTCHTKFFKEEHEAVHHKKKYGGYIVPIDCGLETHYYVHKTKAETMVNGFYPIKHYVYDIMRLMLVELAEDLVKNDKRVLGCYTDTVFTDYMDVKVEKCKSFDDIGKIRYEQGKQLPKQRIVFVENEIEEFGMVFANGIPKEKYFEHEAEWESNQEALNEEIRILKSGTIIEGTLPGSGKTKTCEQYITLNKEKGIFLCSTQERAQKQREKGFEAMTAHSAMGIRLNNDMQVSEHKEKKLEDFEVVIFDEIYTYPLFLLEKVARYVRMYPKVIFIANGDPSQIPPIEKTHLNILNVKEYYAKAIYSIFSARRMLTISKRLKNTEDRKILPQIKEDIFRAKLTPQIVRQIAEKYFTIKNRNEVEQQIKGKKAKCVSYFVETKKEVNKMCYRLIGNPRKQKTYDVNDTKWNEGNEIVCRCSSYTNGIRIVNGFKYMIRKMTNNEITIEDKLTKEAQIIPIEMLKKFEHSYCFTVHTIQGNEYEEVIIFDGESCLITQEWLWVAVTRAFQLSDVSFYFEDKKIDEMKLIKNAINNKIEGHKLYDAEREFNYEPEDYIDTNFILNKCEENCYKCSICRCNLLMYNFHGQGTQFSIDRIDSDCPHTKTNCQIVCLRCNQAKGNGERNILK
jgi:hypothetical protein